MNWDEQALPDDQLEQLVRSLLDEDSVENVIGAALAGWGLRDLDAELARLVFDSLEAGNAAHGSRSHVATERARTFEVDGLTIDFEESAGRIVGQVIPVPVSLAAQTPTATTPVDVDANGLFSAIVEPGPARLVAETADGTTVTEWFVIDAEPKSSS